MIQLSYFSHDTELLRCLKCIQEKDDILML